MASNETGWTTNRPDENGIYWFKRSGMLPEVLLVHGGFVYDFGDKEPTSIGFYDGRGEWSGPLYASDAEQLSELRRVGTEALKVLEHYKERHLVPPYFSSALADLRDALAGVDRTVTVQCADCLAWFDKNANHTCGKQVKANRRAALNPSHAQKERQ